MMADIYSTTPGSAVAETVQQILQRRKDEQRQQMLDTLAVKQFGQNVTNSDRTYDLNKQSEARMQATSEAQIAADKERMFGERVKNMPYGESDVSDLEQSDPEFFKQMLNRQMIRKSTPPVGTVSNDMQLPAGATPEQIESFAAAIGSNREGNAEQAAGPAHSTYRGSPDYQKDMVQQKRIESLITPEMEKENPLLAAVFRYQAGGAQANAPAALLGPKPSVVPISPSGRAGAKVTGDRGTEFMELGYPPNPPAGTQPNIYQIPDGKGGFSTHWLTPGQQPTEANKVQAPGPIVKNNLPASSNSQDLIPGDVRTRLVQAMGSKTTNDDQQAVLNTISNARTSQLVKDTVHDAWYYYNGFDTNGNRLKGWQQPTSVQVTEMIDPSALTPQEYDQAKTLVMMILNNGAQ